MVQNRYFFHAAGFDPSGLAVRHRGFCRETARFATTWNVTASVSRLREPDADGGHWTMTTGAPGWQVRTSFECLDWSDIVRADLARPLPRRLWQAAVAFVDFVGSGTATRYFSAHWKYGIFFLVPFLDTMLFAAVALAAGGYVAFALPSAIFGAVAAALVTAFGFALLMRWPGKRWGVGQALADWVFAREYMRHLRPDMDARIDAFAGRLVACACRPDIDEIIVTGHSLGATIVLDAVSRALDRDPEFGRRGPQLCILTIGATIPKLALHPKGEWLRAKARRIAADASLAWAEYQARDDVISFYRFDPVRLCRIVEGGERPLVRRVQIHDMLGKATARRMRFRFMRRHYQFVMANEQRTIYDYFMLMGGPAPFRQTIHQANGPADLYAADGSLNEPPGASRQKSPQPQ
jgi:hypothetical protein